jgi:hypothetical protein
MEAFKQKLSKKLSDFVNSSYEESLEKCKREDYKKEFKYEPKYYKDLVLVNVTEDDLKSFSIDIEFCETPEQHDIWEYFRVHTSSIKTNKTPGRYIRILVKHVQSGKYIGILALGSDIYKYSARDKYIGWTSEIRKKNLDYIMNITTCVGLQPIAYNLNIGKLLVALCFSDKVLNKFKEKYGHDIACITTFSINGKSIQYDRIKQYIKYIGETKGYVLTNIPNTLYKSCIKYLKMIKDNKTLGYKNKMYKLINVVKQLGITQPENSENKRGVYIGFTSDESINFMNDRVVSFTPRKQTLDEICEWWKNRWAFQRYRHLNEQGKLKYTVELRNAINDDNNERVKKYKEDLKSAIGEEEYKMQQRDYMMNYRNNKDVKTLITEDFEVKENVNNLNLKWFAGFLDGDGSINVVDKKYLRIEIGQCNPFPLFQIESHFGGNINVKDNGGVNSRKIFNWSINCSNVERVVNSISKHVILESEHVNKSRDYFKADDTDTRSKIATEIKSITKSYDKANYDRINDEWISGFFDAEGEVSLTNHNDGKNSKYSICITQKSCLPLLQDIKQYLGYGSVGNARLCIYSKNNIIDFITRMLPYVIGKKVQAQALLDFLNNKILLSEGINVIHNEKYKIYEAEIKKFLKKKTAKKVVKKQEVVKDTVNHVISETGERSYEHRLNLKLGTSLAKHSNRKVSDETILEIRDIYSKGDTTYTKLAEQFNLSRQYITDIVNKKVLTMSEINNGENIKINLDKKVENLKAFEASGMTQEEYTKMKTCIAKRKVPPSTILDIMMAKIETPDIRPSCILEIFQDDNENSKLTIDMVKNYSKGNIKLFEIEFPIGLYTYEQYKDMCEILSDN